MKLDAKEFKRFKELSALVKAGKASSAEQAEFEALQAKKNERGSNAIEWWKNYPELLKDVTNFPFNWIPGVEVKVHDGANNDVSLEFGVIATADLRPGIGRSQSDADAFNSQIRQLWLDLHRKYRGIGTYEKADLGITILAIDSAFETIAKFERIYGVINTYHVGNRVIPTGLKEALHIDDELENNMADFRYLLNLYITKMKQLCLPKGLSVLEADLVSLSNIFKDSDDRRAFLFLFDNDVYGKYDGTSISTGGCVLYQTFRARMTGTTPNGNSAFKLADIQYILETVTSHLLSDDDVARICSDLLAAYGPENVMQLISMPENYVVEPVHDYERQVQFHNLTICSGAASIYDGGVIDQTAANNLMTSQYPIVIYQNNNAVQCRLGRSDGTASYVTLADNFVYPSFDTTVIKGQMKTAEVLFDTWVEQPGEADVMCGTRYTSLALLPSSTAVPNRYIQEIGAFGTKVCVAVTIFQAISSGVYVNHYLEATINSLATDFYNDYDVFLALMQMDWHPIFYIANAGKLSYFGDVDNFTIISFTNLSRLHEVALLSGYKIPMVAQGDK